MGAVLAIHLAKMGQFYSQNGLGAGILVEARTGEAKPGTVSGCSGGGVTLMVSIGIIF